ncbi:microtubule-associated protein futsch, partial [Nephila pilipes]
MASGAPPGCYLLLVLGQPCAQEHKDHILKKVEEGLLSWDVENTKCNLVGLETVCSSIDSSKEIESELLIQYSTENLAVEVLLNPHVSTLKQCLKNLLAANVGHKHVIHAGYAFTGSGSWILQDGSFSHDDFIDTLQDVEVQRALRRHHGYTIHVHCIPEGPWAQQGEDEGALTKIYESLYINPAKQVSVVPGSAILLNCLDSVLKFQPLTEMMKSSPVVGNIRFNRPTLYVFPGGQGDCALFGVSGFTMLIDGGFNRKPCFWEFIRHLDRLDAIMITRLNENNVCGITNVVRRKREGKRVYPQVGYVFCNVAEGKQSPTSPGSMDQDRDPLLVSVIQEGREFSENLQQLGLKPHRCLRDCQVEPLTLFHKVGHGTLEMYVLSPPKDSKEMKLFFQQWTSYKEHFSSRRYLEEREVPIPLSHAMSICALLVWKPADPADTITRVLLPGSAPQSKIFEGLEHLRHLEELKHRTCSQLSLGIKYEERVKVKTTKKHVIKTSATKQKADIVRPSSPIKTPREIDEQIKLQRKRAESPIKLQISSPVRKVKKSTKKVEEKKSIAAKDEIAIKKSISKDIKLVSKKIKKRSRSKEQRLILEDEKRDIGVEDEKIVEPQEDAMISVETESLPKIEDIEHLKIDDAEPDLHEEEKILLETKEHEKILKSPASPEDEHVPLETQEKTEVDKELETIPEKEKKDVEKPVVPEEDKSPVKEVHPKIETEVSKPGETIEEFPDTKTPTEEQKEEERVISESPVQDDVKTSPLPVEKTKTPSPVKEKDVESKLIHPKVPKKKLVSKTTPSTKAVLPSPEILKLRKETEVRKTPVKKEKVMEKESRIKLTTRTPKPAAKPMGVQSPIERTPTPPSRFIAKTKEPTKPRPIKAPTPVRTAPKLEIKSIKIPSVSEIKTKTAKDVVNKRVAESKIIAKQLELVKSKPPATPPKSPMKKPKEKLPVASPKKKPKMPTMAPTRASKPSKDKVKPKPVKRPEKIKEIIPSGSEETKKNEQEEKGPIVPDEEPIPSQVSTPVEKTVDEEMVQSVPSSPKDIQPEIEDITQDVIDKTPSEILEQEAVKVEREEQEPIISEPKEVETLDEKAIEAEIYDEQMVVKEIEAVEAAVDELIEGMRTEIEEAKAIIPSDADDSLQITQQERQDIESQEKEEIAMLKEDTGPPSGEEDSAMEVSIDLKTLDLTQVADATIFTNLRETLEPEIQSEMLFIKDYIKNEGVSLKDSETIIFEVIFEVLRKIHDTLSIKTAKKYINEKKVEISDIVISKYQIDEESQKPKEKESDVTPSKTPSPEREIVEEITEPEIVHISVDQYQTPESKIEISSLANEIKKEMKVENLEDTIAQVVCECLQSKSITPTKESFKNFIIEHRVEIIIIIRKKYLPKREEKEKVKELSEKEDILDEKVVSVTKEEEKSSLELIKNCLTAKGKEEINKLIEDINLEDIAYNDLENSIYEIINSDIQKKQLTVKEEVIILYIIEYRTEIISQVKSKYESVIHEKIEETKVSEPEVIHVNVEQFLTPESKTEISSLANEIKKEIDIENLEQVIAEVVYECLQNKSITPTKETFTKYIIEYRIEVLTIIRKKYLHERIEKEVEVPSKKEETPSVEEKAPKEKEESPSEEIHIPEEERMPSEKEVVPSEEVEVPEEEKVTSEKEKELTKDEEERLSPLLLKKCLTSRGKEVMNKLIEDIKIENISSDIIENTLYEILSSNLQEKHVSVTEDVIILYIIEYRTEIISQVKSMLATSILEAKEISELEVTDINLEQYLTPESKIEISSLVNEIKKEINIDNLEDEVLEIVSKNLQNKSIIPTKESFTKYIVEYRVEIITIIRNKYTKERVEEEMEIPSEKEETSKEMQILKEDEKVSTEKEITPGDEEPHEKEIPVEKEMAGEIPSSRKEKLPGDKEKALEAKRELDEKEIMPTEKDISFTEEVEEPSPESIKKCLTGKGKEEINKLIEDIKLEGIVQDDLENTIYEIISSDIQKKQLTVKEDLIILYIIEFRTEIISQIKSKYVTIIHEEKEVKITEPEEIRVNVEQYLTPESKIEISSLANEIKKEIDIDNLEQTIAEVVYECLKAKSITPTKEIFAEYIVEYRVEIITIIRKKCQQKPIEKEVYELSEAKEVLRAEDKLSPEKEEIPIKEKAPTIKEVITEKEVVSIGKEEIIDEKDKASHEKEMIAKKEKVVPTEIEELTRKEEDISLEREMTSTEKDEEPSEKGEPIEKEKVLVEDEEVKSSELIKKSLTEKGKQEIDRFIEDLHIKDLSHEDIEDIIYEILNTELRKKQYFITEEVIILYIIEHRTEIISQIKGKYVTLTQKDVDELIITEGSVEEKTPLANIMECITPEVKNVINDLAKAIQVEKEMLENTIEIILQTLSEEMQEKNISVESNQIIKYVTQHKKEITDIVQNKLTTEKEKIEDKAKPETPLESEKHVEPILTCEMLKNYLNSEARDIISIFIEELKLENISDNLCEEIVLNSICQEIKKKNITFNRDDISKYIVEYRIEILTIIKNRSVQKEIVEGISSKKEKKIKEGIIEKDIFETEIPVSKEETLVTEDEKDITPTLKETPSLIAETEVKEKAKEKEESITKKVEDTISSTFQEIKKDSPVSEKVTTIELQEKEAVVEKIKEKAPSPVEETKAITPEAKEPITEEPEKKIPSPLEEIKKVSPVDEKIKTMEIQEPEEKEAEVSPVEEKIKAIEIEEPEEKEAVIQEVKAKTPSPADETKAISIVAEEKEELVTEEIKKKILSPEEEIKKVSPVDEKVKTLEIQELEEKESEVKDLKEKTPSPTEETKAVTPEAKEPITEEPEKKIPSPVEDVKKVSPVDEKLTMVVIQKTGKKESLIEDLRKKTPSPVDEIKDIKDIDEKTSSIIELKVDEAISAKKDDITEDTKMLSSVEIPVEPDSIPIYKYIFKHLSPESKREVSSLAAELMSEIDICNLEEIIVEVVCDYLQSKSIVPTKENFTKYIIEYKIEIISIIRKKYIRKIPSRVLEIERKTDLEIKSEKIPSAEIKIIETDEIVPTEEIMSKSIEGKSEKLYFVEERKPLDIAKDEIEDKKRLSSVEDRDSELKIMHQVFLKEVSNRIENYDLLLKELDHECLFPRSSSADVLYNTVCSEMNRKGIIITSESIIKYIIEYKIEIIKIIKTKYSKNIQEVSTKGRVPVSSEFIMDASAFDLTYDEDILSPMAESIMGEEIEIHEELAEFESDSIMRYETVKDLHIADVSKDIAEAVTPKTVYEKPEAEQVFRHIFAETIVDDEIEVLQDGEQPEFEDLSQTSLKDEDQEKADAPDSMKKKLMYVEIEIEESVTSTTDASPDTDAPEIPYDGKYKERIDEDLNAETDTKESIEKVEGKDITETVLEMSERDIESKQVYDSVHSVSGVVREELSPKLDSKEISTSSKKQEIQQEEPRDLKQKLTSTGDIKDIGLKEGKKDETLEKLKDKESEESAVKDTDSKEKRDSPESVTTEIKKEEQSFVLSATDTPSESEISKLLIKTNIVEGDSTVSETVTKISSSKTVSSEVSEETFTTVTKTEKDEDTFESVTTITTTKLIRSGDSDAAEQFISKTEKDKKPPHEIKSISKDVESETMQDKDQEFSLPKIVSPTKSLDVEDVQVREETGESDVKSKITKTVATITRKIIEPSEDAEKITQGIEDDQKLPSPKSESAAKISDEEETHATEEVDGTDGASPITRTITTVTRKIVVPSEDAEETTQEIKDDQKTSSSKSTSPAVTPHVDDAQVTEEIDESDGTSTITRTITTVTRKIVVPSEDAEETTQEIKDDQKVSSLQSASPAMTHVDDAQVTEEIDESDETSTITKTVTTITHKIIAPSEETEEKKDDQKLPSPKS